MSLLIRKAVLFAKTELMYGVDALTDPVNDGLTHAILVKNVSVTPLAQDLIARDVVTPYLGNDEQIAATTRVEISFEVEMAGAGAPGDVPAYGPLLESCAMAQLVNMGISVEYTPISDGFKSMTLVYNVDGVQHKLRGARGSVVATVDARGIPVYAFSFTGLYVDVVDQIPGAVDYSMFLKPLAANEENTPAFSLFGQEVVMQQLVLDAGNSVVYRNLVGDEKVLITDRASVGSCQFEMTTVTEYDWFAEVKATNTGAMSLQHGTMPGNIVELVSNRAQITNPSVSDSDGVAMIGFDINYIPSSAGNDEFKIIVR